MAETATATNPTEANASTEASGTLLATAGGEAGETQQTQTAETQTAATTETSTEATKTDGETKATGTEGENTGKNTPVGAPETYEFKSPEGTEYDPDVLAAFAGAAKAANLPQDAAQKLIDTMAPALVARQVDQVKAIHKEWADASAADKEFGGETLKANLGVARKALDTFGTPELRTLLDETGLGNHPEVLRLLYRAGKAISEDTFVGGTTGAKPANPLDALYPKSQKGK